MAGFHETIKARSGIALGGIGAGSVELFPDGELHEWQIYNTPRWASRCSDSKVDDGEKHTGALSFFVRTKEENGKTCLRRLGFHTESEEFTYRMFTAVKPVEAIDFEGRFPTARLLYHDRELPVALSSLWTAPFVPHKEDDSASPAFSVVFTLENRSGSPLEVSLAAKLKTPFCNQKGQTHRLYFEKEDTFLSITPAANDEAPDTGSLALSMSGKGTPSAIGGDYARYLDEYVSHSEFGLSQESFLFPFLASGSLPHTAASVGEEAVFTALPEDFFPAETAGAALSEEELTKKLALLAAYPFAESLLARIRGIKPAFPETKEEKLAFLKACERQVRDFQKQEKPFGSAALCQKITLAPGEKTSLRFLFSWHFPHHKGENDRFLGHYYANLYPDALAVNRTLAGRFAEVFGEAGRFSDALYDTTLPESYPDAWSSQLSTLVKDSWWLADGRFGLWEGLGYCGFATTDITYHASFGLAALFPALQKRQMRMTADFRREDGRIPHFFTPDLYHVDDGFHRVDMNPQFVLLAARDYLLHGDREQLSYLWPAVEAAMEATAALDENGDGLPDRDTAYNTYDAWHFSGTPAYIAFLWLAALKAAVKLAGVMGKADCAHRWQALLDKGCESAEVLLYNGEYYDLWSKAAPGAAQEGDRDGCLMSNQLDGEVFLRLIGLPGNLSDERVGNVLDAIFRHNFEPGAGLVNASTPAGRTTTLYTYKNCQAEARWTGVEYLFAAALEGVGRKSEAEELVDTVAECQRRLGYFFNHWECGFRYTRPLSSWTTLLAASGFSFDAGAKTLSLLPPEERRPGRYPVVTGSGLLTARFDREGLTLDQLAGTTALSILRLPAPGTHGGTPDGEPVPDTPSEAYRSDGEPVSESCIQEKAALIHTDADGKTGSLSFLAAEQNGVLTLTLSAPLTLTPGTRLAFTFLSEPHPAFSE